MCGPRSAKGTSPFPNAPATVSGSDLLRASGPLAFLRTETPALSRKTIIPDTPMLDADGQLVFRRAGAVMTPRTATVEANHILKAYVDGSTAAARRIETYGKLERERLAASIRIAPGFVCPFEGRAILFSPSLKHYDRPSPDRRKRSNNHAPAGFEPSE